jgi:putative spermidine/putrescine transport system ATP-binding protein
MADVVAGFRRVDKSYDGETLVVRGLDLDVHRGEFLTLLGPSGSGKTTCLMMLAGFETPTRGEIVLDGRVITHLPPHRRGIGVVFQNYALFPHMTVADNVGFPLRVRGVSRPDIAARVRRTLEMVQLGGFETRRPAQLSGGQQQRVAVARALVFEPKLVLMDEPLGALDRQLREEMQYEIKHLHARVGVTVVYVTHDQAEALTMSDRIAVMSDGVIQQLAAPADLYEHPVNAFVARFIGESNQLPGTVVAISGGACTVELPGGDRVTALAVNIGPVGSRATLSLRPERIQINPERSGCANVFDARVEELTYLGDHVRVRLAAGGRRDLVAKLPSVPRRADVEPGKSVRIAWHLEDGRALDAPSQPPPPRPSGGRTEGTPA